MTTHRIRAWTDYEAAAISGDPHPELVDGVYANDDGLLWLVDDGADILIEEVEVEYYRDLVTNAAVAVVALAVVFGLGVIVGLAR